MRANPLQEQADGKHRGYALLMLLIVIALGMLIYYFALYPSIDRKPTAEQMKSPDEYPWVEEFRLRKRGQKAQHSPSPEQPNITEAIRLAGRVRHEEKERGTIEMVIKPDGTVEGTWMADYGVKSPRRDYTVMKADFKGNTDPSKIYAGEESEDPSKLFMITRGNFLILETDYETGEARKVAGYIYVVGWLAPDHAAFGRLHLTTDKRTQTIFEWAGKPAALFPFSLISD
jgi:hypothetical protein